MSTCAALDTVEKKEAKDLKGGQSGHDVCLSTGTLMTYELVAP